MTKTNQSSFAVLRKIFYVWLLFLPLLFFSQGSGTIIKWDFQVGCAQNLSEYDPKLDNGQLFQGIERSECIRVCEDKEITYTIEGANITNVQWNIGGGVLQSLSGAGNTQAIIKWGVAGNGSIQITITYSNGTTENRTICVEKINRPTANFQAAGGIKPKVCRNTPIYFDNISDQNGGSDILYYHWDFGDGTFSNAFEPSHTYTTEGIYPVTLTVTNQCNCTHSITIDVEVLKADPVTISCASVVCEGSVETYTASDNCGGDWEVKGGTIVANNGNSIEVKWDQVDPSEGFGYVMYLSKCTCPEWVTVKVPVILNKAKIKGKEAICAGKQEKYSLPQWPATSFQWSVSGPGSAQLNYNEHRNEVFFTANQTGTYILSCTYINTLLGCKGYAEITINVDAPVTITGGSDEICSNTTQTFNANPGTNVIWQVTKDNAVIYTSATPSPTLPNFLFSTPGTYLITATKPGGCTGDPRIIRVVQTPPAPTGNIIGERRVCTGVPYTYSIATITPGTIPVWEVTNGTIQGSNSGQSVTVIFNPGATSFAVSVRNKSLDPVGCLSDPLTLLLKKINLTANIVAAAPGPYCPSSSMVFKVDFNGVVPDQIEWSFASLNFGSVVSGQGTNQITVNFNEISSGVNSTNLRLKVIKCGVEYFFNYPVELYQLPVINFTNIQNICLGESGLSFSINQGGITSATDVVFTFSNGSTHPATFNASGNYIFPNQGYIQNNTGANITQTVTVTINGAHSCSYKPTASASFVVYPETVITITPAANVEICDPTNYTPYTLYANMSTGITPSTVFEWRKNNVIVQTGSLNSFLIQGTNPYGTYFVRVKDANGCWVRSQTINVTQECNDNTCGIPEPTINVTANWTGCNTLSAQASYSVVPDQVQWLSNSVLTLTGGQGTNDAQFTTNIAGVHLVTVRIRVGNCWFSKTIEMIKRYQPKFNITQTCSNNGTFDVTLHNSSTIFDINQNDITFTWGNGGPFTQTGQTASFSNLSPGVHTFTLTLTSANNLPCTITETYTIAPTPNLNFTGLPASVCKGEVVTLTIPNFNSNNTYKWFFDNTAYVASGPTTEITFNNSGPNSIYLQVTTPQSCVYTGLPHIVQVVEDNFAGILQAFNTNSCEGSSSNPSITYIPNFASVTPTSYIWMNGNQPVAGAPNTSSFNPTVSGNYWPILKGSTGCMSYIMATQAVSVTVRPKPYVNISGKTSICANQSTTLFGIVTDNTLEYQWLKNGNVAVSWTNSPYPITINTGNLTAGTHTFRLMVRPAGDPGCENYKDFTVTVSNPPSQVGLSYNIVQCQPYKVEITATGPSNGQYNWSNGMTGQTITVTHGGIYRVTYTAPSGCIVENDITVPQSIESLMWIFPTGCYDVCPDGTSYLIGPRGIYDGHNWQLNGSNIQGGSFGFINPLYVNQAGTYNLEITQGICTVKSGDMNVNPDPQLCKLDPCKIGVKVEVVRGNGNPNYTLYGEIYNYASTPVVLTITSANGYGTYSPSIITIPAGGTYNMWTNPILFYPNATFPGGIDDMIVKGYGCEVKEPVDYSLSSRVAASSEEKTVSGIQVTPNPSKDMAEVIFDTGNSKNAARMITVHDASGTLKFQQELKASSGKVSINVSQWLQGVYIVSVVTSDKPLQAKLLKK